MATKQPIIKQSLGNIPTIRAQFYSDNKKPEFALSEGQRASFIRFKTDKDTNTLRQSFGVIVHAVSSAKVRDTDRGAEMLQQMIHDYQDTMLRRCADGSVPFESCELADKLVADYFDTTRTSSGNRVTTEILGKWFDDNAAEWMAAKIVAKFPQFDASKSEAVLKQYRNAVADLAKYGLPLTKPVTAMLNKFHAEFSYAEDDDMQEFIGERLKKLTDKHNADENLLDAI